MLVQKKEYHTLEYLIDTVSVKRRDLSDDKTATILADATVRFQGVKGGSSIPKQPPSSSDESIDQVVASAFLGQNSDDGLNQPISELSQ